MSDKITQNPLLIQQMTSIKEVKLNTVSAEIEELHLNIQQKLIIITEDKLKIKLQAHLNNVEKKKDWIAPLSVMITIALALVSTEFKDFLLTKETWKAFFILILILSIFWLLFTIKQAVKSSSIESFIEEIKSDSKSQSLLSKDLDNE